MIRKIRKKDYDAIDRLLLQLHKVHVEGRPELFRDGYYDSDVAKWSYGYSKHFLI